MNEWNNRRLPLPLQYILYHIFAFNANNTPRLMKDIYSWKKNRQILSQCYINDMKGGKYMKIRHLQDNEEGKGIFHYINEHIPLSFAEEVDIDVLDMLLIAKHGQRELSPLAKSVIGYEDITPITPLHMQVLARMLSVYADKWNNLYNIYLDEVTVDSYKLTTVENETDKTTDNQNVETTTNATDTENVSGYDSDTLVKDRENVRADNDTSKVDGVTDKDRQLDRTVSGSQGNRLDDRAKALELLDQTFFDTLLSDVANEIGLLIYN